MQFIEGRPPETQYAPGPGDRAKRREVPPGSPRLEPAGRVRTRMAEFKAFPRPKK
jgi:hypothetical protein